MVAAKKCRYCGEYLANQGKQQSAKILANQMTWNPWFAAALSLFIPGLGQIYSGFIGAGIVFFILVAFGYANYLPLGSVLHLICVLIAFASGPRLK